MTMLWILLATLYLCFLAALLVFGYLRNRKRPRCPFHGIVMELWSDSFSAKEYVCCVEGCKWCADVKSDGKIKYFEV
jgi:hypothetical protein